MTNTDRSKILRALDTYGRDRFYAEEQQSIVVELRDAGIGITRLYELLSFSVDEYGHALAALVRHLGQDYSDATIETLARALATKRAAPFWPSIAARYREQPSTDVERGVPSGAKDGLALALAEIATRKNVHELAEFATDARNGRSRAFLLKALRKYNTAEANEAIDKLRVDPEFSTAFDAWLRRH